jgi:hypothetical protein
MEGMDTQDILGEQDLSNANIDDLLAAMKAEESSAGFLREDVGTATDVGNAAAIDDAPIDVLNAIADAAPDAQDIIEADAAMTEALEGIATDVQSEELAETLGEGESIDIEPIEELLDTEETAEEVTDEAVDEAKEAEPAVDVDAMLAAMAEAETATDVDAMLDYG